MTAWILSPGNCADVTAAINNAPFGARVTLDAEPGRTHPQNRLMWKLLGAFADQVVHGGRKYEAEIWKCILLKAFGKELAFVPSLDGSGVVALGYRSSMLKKEEMSHFIEFIYSEGVRIGVAFHDEWIPPARLAEPAKALAP